MGCGPLYRSLVRSEVENIVDESNPQQEKQSRCCPVSSLPTISVFTLQFSPLFSYWVFLILSVEEALTYLKTTPFLQCGNLVSGFNENWVWGPEKWDSRIGVGVAGLEMKEWERREVAGDEVSAGQHAGAKLRWGSHILAIYTEQVNRAPSKRCRFHNCRNYLN